MCEVQSEVEDSDTSMNGTGISNRGPSANQVAIAKFVAGARLRKGLERKEPSTGP